MAREAPLVDVRRLAAIDMHGLEGTPRRRRVIITEFVLGAIGGLALGLLLLTSDGAVGIAFGVWAVGVGVNYVPLALHTLSLRDPGDLRAELAGTDVRAELRRYTARQFWVFVPFLFAALALAQARAT